VKVNILATYGETIYGIIKSGYCRRAPVMKEDMPDDE
jgi:hypothetical protein